LIEPILVYGAGEFGSLIENLLVPSLQYRIGAFCDDDPQKIGTKNNGVEIISPSDIGEWVKKHGVKKSIAAIGNNQIRAEKYFVLKEFGLEIITIKHSKALIDTDVTVGPGSVIEMGSAIHTHSTIGENTFIGGEALIGHHNRIGHHVLVGGGAAFGGSVTVGDLTTIGVGASIKPGITIGQNCVIGVGSVVIKDIPDDSVAVGVPAKVIKSV